MLYTTIDNLFLASSMLFSIFRKIKLSNQAPPSFRAKCDHFPPGNFAISSLRLRFLEQFYQLVSKLKPIPKLRFFLPSFEVYLPSSTWSRSPPITQTFFVFHFLLVQVFGFLEDTSSCTTNSLVNNVSSCSAYCVAAMVLPFQDWESSAYWPSTDIFVYRLRLLQILFQSRW